MVPLLERTTTTTSFGSCFLQRRVLKLPRFSTLTATSSSAGHMVKMLSLWPTTGIRPFCHATSRASTNLLDTSSTQRWLSVCTTLPIKEGLPSRISTDGLLDSCSFDFIDGYAKSVKGRKINWMKAGFLESDLNISKNKAAELVSGEDKGVELDSIVRKQGIVGIINGMDVQEWDPSADKYLDTPYAINTVFEAKPVLKEALQAEVGLPIRPDVPLFGFIGRLEEQKSSDILAEAVKDFLKDDVQLIVLGTGKKHLEKQLEELDTKFPGKAVGVVKFNTPLAHMIAAGADFILVPSRFEPCGLIQLHGMRYGTPPVVASTGGLVDTVTEGVTGFQVGKAFNVDCEKVDPEDVKLLAATVKRAVQAYRTPQLKTMIKACMDQDLSWKGPARTWEETLLGLQVEGSGPGQEGEEIAPKAKANVAAP